MKRARDTLPAQFNPVQNNQGSASLLCYHAWAMLNLGLSHGYKDPAASLIGAVLEDGMRRIAAARDVASNRGDGLDSLNQKLARAEVYNAIVQKQIDVWRQLRNGTDHANFAEYTLTQVSNMQRGVTQFLAEYLK
jgi:hypothetical protein